MTKRNAIELLEKRYYEKDMTQEEQDTLETKNFFFFVVGLYGMEVVKSEEKKIGKSGDAFRLVQHSLNTKKKRTSLMEYIKNKLVQISRTEDVRPGTYISKLVSYLALYSEGILGEEYYITSSDKIMIFSGMCTDY